MLAITGAAEAILLKLYECSAKHDSYSWSFESACRTWFPVIPESDHAMIFDRLIEHGWISTDLGWPPYDVVSNISGPDLSGDKAVRLTPRGIDAAIGMLKAREPKTFIQRIHSWQWGTWGGMAAIVAALASICGAIFSYRAIP